ncbi:MAG: cytochrome c biogenesis protein ResB [Flavobacteriaceae bacterium]|nr:cytochrome c biogenesis protein ResB [Flavobacteriaceae bacterium]
MSNHKNQHKLWDFPWAYAESFLIYSGLLITGFLMEIFFPLKTTIGIVFPYNLFILVGIVASIIILQLFFKKHVFVKWLGSVNAAIMAIIFIFLMVMIMGIIPQIKSESTIIQLLGLNSITTHWAFLLILLVFLISLGLTTFKRILNFNVPNIGFILNHLGLFIALSTGILGAGDTQRLNLELEENAPNWMAYNNKTKTTVELDFAIYLKDFKVDEFQPKLAFVDNEKGEIIHNDGKNLYLINQGEQYFFNEYEIKINKYLASSAKVENDYHPVHDMGAPPSSFLTVRNTKTDKTVKGWISSGSFLHQYESLKIDKNVSVVMTIPEVKKFTSEVSILQKNGNRIETAIEVNKPFDFNEWKIYQLSYDEKMGKWSTKSVLELVKDPWLKYVYTGIFMMITGAIYMFWAGAKFKKENNHDLD